MTITIDPGAEAARVYDSSGFALFSTGDTGAAHIMSHHLLDSGRAALGHRLLGRWLEGRAGSGSDWCHIQFHMALFELAAGRWDSAWQRFGRELLPAASRTANALTDAPALLWRLALSAPRAVEPDWGPLRLTALASLERTDDPYVELHHLLALAGARDLCSLDAWLASQPTDCESESRTIVVGMGSALREFAAGRYGASAAALEMLAPQIHRVGGSRAQNELFQDLAETAWRLAGGRRLAA